MSLTARTIIWRLLLGSALSLTSVLASAQDQPAPDNTRTNKEQGVTAEQQKNTPSDRETTRQIRRALVKDDSLSTYAHNIKIITQNGTVTLKGPVTSEEEKMAVEAKAKEVAGVANVSNQLEVVPKK